MTQAIITQSKSYLSVFEVFECLLGNKEKIIPPMYFYYILYLDFINFKTVTLRRFSWYRIIITS